MRRRSSERNISAPRTAAPAAPARSASHRSEVTTRTSSGRGSSAQQADDLVVGGVALGPRGVAPPRSRSSGSAATAGARTRRSRPRPRPPPSARAGRRGAASRRRGPATSRRAGCRSRSSRRRPAHARLTRRLGRAGAGRACARPGGAWRPGAAAPRRALRPGRRAAAWSAVRAPDSRRASRSSASSRLRAWLRASWATADHARAQARTMIRRFCSSLSAVEASTSNEASIRARGHVRVLAARARGPRRAHARPRRSGMAA